MYRKYDIYIVKKTKFNLFQCDHMIHIYSIPSPSLLPSPLKPKTLHLQTKHFTSVADLTSLVYFSINYRMEIHFFVIILLLYCICMRWIFLPFQLTVYILYLLCTYIVWYKMFVIIILERWSLYFQYPNSLSCDMYIVHIYHQ